MRPAARTIDAATPSFSRRALAVLTALCLLLGQYNGGLVAAYATGADEVELQVGPSVTAVLSDGVLTLSGTGDTDDFTADAAPFAVYASEVRALVVEEGVSYIGSCLFYGLGGLEGELTLPGSVVGIGDGAFSGNGSETAPRFSAVRNLFESGEVVRSGDDGYAVDRIVQQDIAHPETLFYPGQAGEVTCSSENGSFMEAALTAGYERAGGAEDAEAAEPVETGEAGLEAEAQPEALQDEEAALASEGDAPGAALAAAEGATVVYVNQLDGSDGNPGTADEPKATLAGAAALLTSAADGGTTEGNRILIQGTYTRSSDERNLPAVPFTLAGADGDAVLQAPEKEAAGVSDHPLYLGAGFRLENIETVRIDHVYGNGHDLVIGEGVTTKGLYLYGYGQNALGGSSPSASVTALSGRILRIVGYLRSTPALDCGGRSSTVTVGGTASVDAIVAGSASGAVSNADVTVNVEGGYVGTLIGGNQGFSANPSPFTGKTKINVDGGQVKNLYGAGSGRNQSVPTYRGDLDIDVTGGKVENLYGAGSAAYVISDGVDASRVSVSVSGKGRVDSLFAAGKGWDDTSSLGIKNDTNMWGGFPEGTDPADFGSLTGTVEIAVEDGGTVGDMYASGQGYVSSSGDSPDEGTKSNAYLDGEAVVRVSGGTVTGSVYGGGKGIELDGYGRCARVTEGSRVRVEVTGGTVQGNVYGGGRTASVDGSASVAVSGGTVQGNVYGGSLQGAVGGATRVDVDGGTVNGSVYGGAYGVSGSVLVAGGSTVNMTDGWVRGNLYGGSELSDDGAVVAEGEAAPDLIVVNLVGGTVGGNVFGGGYRGTVNGSTHLHVGTGALDACSYYAGAGAEAKPALSASSLTVGGSVYAGGDFGGDGSDYDAVTVIGTSHVYVDGGGYDTGSGASGAPSMTVEGGVFGSGASCDAGQTRLVTLANYGEPVAGDGGAAAGATRTLTAVQRADRVLLLDAHVRLSGQSDAANADQTALYSLNRIGDHGEVDGLGSLGGGLVLQSGSTLVLDAPAIELAALRSLDADGKEATATSAAEAASNALLLNNGTLLRVSCSSADGEQYGPVKGFARLLAGESAEGYAYARIAPGGESDGGFVDGDGKEMAFTEQSSYRYWKVSGGGEANVTRQTVLTARTLESSDAGYGEDGYAVAKGVIELPPAEDGSTYTVKSVETSNARLVLAGAAKTGQGGAAEWQASGGDPTGADAQKAAIADSPLTTFGLFMKPGTGFAPGSSGAVVTTSATVSSIDGTVSGDAVPQIEFYLTYYNEGIVASQDPGTVTVVLQRSHGGAVQETTTASVQIVTRAANLSSLEMDLYATQGGSYAGKLYIPAGTSRQLTLVGVSSSDGSSLVPEGSSLSDNRFSLSLQAKQSQGWQSSGLMDAPCDLGSFAAGSPVRIGTTDSRHDAPIDIVLTNAPGFPPKDQADTVTLALEDASSGGSTVSVVLRIHWEQSAVASVEAGAGRQHNALTPSEGALAITQDSALTAAFSLSSPLSAAQSWVELRDEAGGSTVALPKGTELTLSSGEGFYRYEATGAEEGGRVKLGDFVAMSGGGHLSGNVAGSVSVIVDFGSSSSKLALGEYSLRLRNEGTADSVGAGFTVNNAAAKASVGVGGGSSQGAHAFELSLSRGSDTRFSGGATAVLSLADGAGFPEGTAFSLDGETSYPSGGKAYIPLSGGDAWTIEMDAPFAVGLAAGLYALDVQVFPTGASAGDAAPLTAAVGFAVEEGPSYALSVSQDSEESRIVEAGGALSFSIAYAVRGAAAEPVRIDVSAQRKTDAGYQNVQGWTVSGNDPLVAESSGTQTISVVAPAPLEPGTYRLLFKLGDREVPYNVVVAKP